MKIHKIAPDPNCKACRGSGETVDYHPYGSTTAPEYLLCDCVLEQVPEGCEDDVIEIVIPGIGEPIVVHGSEFDYDDYLDLWQ